MKTITKFTASWPAALAIALIASAAPAKQPTVAAGAACEQLGDTSALLALVYEPGTFYAARKVEKNVFRARAIQTTQARGAALYMRAEAGLTGEYLERALSCHAASTQTVHPNDPLHPSSGTVSDVSVHSASNGFAVVVMAEDGQTGREIWRRAELIAEPSGAIRLEQLAQRVH